MTRQTDIYCVATHQNRLVISRSPLVFPSYQVYNVHRQTAGMEVFLILILGSMRGVKKSFHKVKQEVKLVNNNTNSRSVQTVGAGLTHKSENVKYVAMQTSADVVQFKKNSFKVNKCSKKGDVV